jgi:2',3'-cyclic-nucleotide 2'-phosphodiesterase (5'-nucleotidase family)
MKKLIYIPLFLFLFFSGCQNNKTEEQISEGQENKDSIQAESNLISDEIIIIHVNDLHGKIDQLPKLSALKKEYEKTHKNVFLFSAGDLFSGNPIVDQYQKKGLPIIDLMNQSGFDLSVLGNHEFDYNQQTLAKRIQDAEFDFICSNIVPDYDSIKLPEYKQLILNDTLLVSIVGFTQVSKDGIPDTHPKKVEGIEFIQGSKIGSRFTGMKDSTDLFIALSHMGLHQDSIFATQFPQFDLIIGGHTHTKYSKKVTNTDVYLSHAAYDLKFAGVLKIKFENSDIIISEDLVDLNEYKNVDSTLLTNVKEYNNNEYFKTIIGQAENTFTKPVELGNLMADVIRISTGSDLSFVPIGGIRKETIKKGPVTIHDIFQLDPFNNEIHIIEITHSQLMELIKICFAKQNIKHHLVPSGCIINADDKSDYKIRFDFDNPDLKNSNTIKIAVSSYVANVYEPLKDLQSTATGKYSAEELISYIRNSGNIAPDPTNRTLLFNNRNVTY